jgi:hypothetical protein
LGLPGYSLDPEPCAAEEAGAEVAAAVHAARLGTSVTVRLRRAECLDVVASLRPFVSSVVAYPSRTPAVTAETGGEGVTPGNCKNYDEARWAERLGLPAMQAVCVECPYREGCKYLEDLEAVREVDHVVMTAARAEHTDLEEVCEGRDAVLLVNHRSLDVVKPSVEALMSKGDALESLDRIIKAVRATYGEDDFYRAVRETAQAIRALVESESGGVVDVAEGDEPPYGWACRLKARFGRVKPPRGFEALVRICVLNARGKLDGPPAVRPPNRGRVGVLAARPVRQLDQPVLVADPTVSAGELEEAVGRPVRVIEPRPRAPRSQAAQVPAKVTGRKRPGPTAAMIRAHLWRHGGKVGVVLPWRLVEPVRAALGAGLAGRVELAGWGGAPLAECGLTLVLGLPPVSASQVARRLVQTGRAAVAARDGDWGPAPWTTEAGEVVSRSAYRDPAWGETHRGIRMGLLWELLQGLTGRVVVYADEPLGFPPVRAPTPLDAKDWTILACLRGARSCASPESAPKVDPSSSLTGYPVIISLDSRYLNGTAGLD